MEVQQAPHMAPHHPTHSPYKDAYMAMSQYPAAQYGRPLPDEDSSHSHHSEHGSDRASPAAHQEAAQSYHHQAIYGGFYNTLPANYSRQQQGHYGGYPNAAVMDFSQKAAPKRDTESPHSDRPEELGETRGYGSGHHTVAGGMVGVALDSEGSSVKSSSSDTGSYLGEGTHSPPSQSPSPPMENDTNRDSPLSTTSSGDMDQPMSSKPEHHVTADEPISDQYQQFSSPDRHQGSGESHTDSNDQESPQPASPRTPENQPISPQDKGSSAKKQRLSSPNLNKIESVINNLRTAKAKKKEKREAWGHMNGVDPTAAAQQLPASDPRNLWAMYALSQYAMMAPGAGAGAYYPYRTPEGAAYPNPLQSMMAQCQAVQQTVAMTEASSGKKRKQDELEGQADHPQHSPINYYNSHPANRHLPEVKSEPLDFSRAGKSPPQPSENPQPYSPSRRMERTRSPATKGKNRKVKEQVVSDHSAIWAELNELALTLPGAKTILEQYQKSVDEFETERYQALLDNISSDQCKDAVHAYFNEERLSLVRRSRVELQAVRQQAEEAASRSMAMSHMMGHSQAGPFSHSTASPFTPVMNTPTMASYPYANALYGLAANTVPQPAAAVPNFGAYSPMASYMAKAMADDAAVMYGQNPEDSENSTKRKFLTSEAVSLLQAWYDKHEDHPYPDEDTVEDLAREAKVSVPQVKKWMANKRVRSSNTLAFNGSIHPKKIQKLIQLKEMAETMGTQGQNYSAASQPNQPQPMQQQAVTHSPAAMAGAAAPQKNRNASGSTKKNKRLLDPSAVAYMTQWYHEHIMYPYPTDDEKHQIADNCSLTISQVTCWFANKRNRSNHSRKHSMSAVDSPVAAKMTVYDQVKLESHPQSYAPQQQREADIDIQN